METSASHEYETRLRLLLHGICNSIFNFFFLKSMIQNCKAFQVNLENISSAHWLLLPLKISEGL